MEQIKLRKHTERQRLSILDKRAKIIPTLRRQEIKTQFIEKTNQTKQLGKKKEINENPIRTNKNCALKQINK